MKRLLVFGAAIAALIYFLDPKNGGRRRSMTRDGAVAFFRQSGKKAGRAGRTVAAEAHGLTKKATQLTDERKPQRETAAPSKAS